MKKNIFCLLFGLLIYNMMHGQTWNPLGAGDENLPVQAFGANQSIFVDAADTAYTIYYDKLINNGVTVRRYNGSAWESLGHVVTHTTPINEFSPAPIIRKGPGNELYSLTRATANGYGIVVKKYNGSIWEPVGSPDIGFGTYYTTGKMEVDAAGMIYVAYLSSGQMRIRKFNGATWINVGLVLTNQIDKFSFSLDNNGIPHICYTRLGNTFVTWFNGTSWVLLQSFPNTSFGSMIFDSGNNLYIAGTSGIKKYNGTTWTNLPVTSNMNLDAPRPLVVDQSGVPYVITKVSDLPFTRVALQKFSGVAWITVGSEMNTDYYVENVQLFITSGGPLVLYNTSMYQGSIVSRPSVKKWTGSSWAHLGSNGFSEAQPFHMKMAMNTAGDHYVIFREWHDSLVLNKRVGSNWVKVSNPQVRSTGWTDIAFDVAGTLYLVYNNMNQKPEVKKFDGVNWSTVGGISVSGNVRASDIEIHPDGTPYVAYYSGQNVYVVKFNGTAWIPVGTTVQAIPPGAYPSIVFDNIGVLHLCILEDDYIRKLAGNSWQVVGNEIDYANFSITLRFDNNNVPWVVYSSNNGGYTSAKKLSGNIWTAVGPSLGHVSDAESYYSAFHFDANNLPYVMYMEIVPASTLMISAYYVKMKKFNGTNWVPVGDRIATGECHGGRSEFPIDFGFINGTVPLAVFNSGHAFAKSFMSGALPLILLNLNVTLQDGGSRLTWTTTAEYGVDSFVVQRSMDGAVFVDKGSLAPKNTAGNHTYDFTDPLTNVNLTRVYYRLKIRNKDGNNQYSKIVMLQRNQQQLTSLLKNPVTDQLYLSVNTLSPVNLRFSIFSADGRLLSGLSKVLSAGQSNMGISISHLPRGFYLLEVSSKDSKELHRFLKQ